MNHGPAPSQDRAGRREALLDAADRVVPRDGPAATAPPRRPHRDDGELAAGDWWLDSPDLTRGEPVTELVDLLFGAYGEL